jgi:hypothetical protein
MSPMDAVRNAAGRTVDLLGKGGARRDGAGRLGASEPNSGEFVAGEN